MLAMTCMQIFFILQKSTLTVMKLKQKLHSPSNKVNFQGRSETNTN